MAMEGKTPEWIEQKEAGIRDVWDVFDNNKSGQVIVEEVGTMLRMLGIYPGEKELVMEIIEGMKDEDATETVAIDYNKFEKKALELLASKQHEPDSAEVLLQAFRTIDTENKGNISGEILETLLTSKGTGFRPKEVEQFLTLAKDPETGTIYYEDYIAELMNLNKRFN